MVSQVVNRGLAGGTPEKTEELQEMLGSVVETPRKKGELYITVFNGGFYVFNNPNRYFKF